ncbi:MAG: hypothetical protein ACRDT6_00870 [Micromonosporaceae bacterium]
MKFKLKLVAAAACALAVGGAVFAATGASAATRAVRCDNDATEVQTCASLDVVGDKVKATGFIRDLDGGRNWLVDVRRVELQYNKGQGWVTIGSVYDVGFKDDQDGMITGAKSCPGHGTAQFRARAFMAYKVVGSSMEPIRETWYSHTYGAPCELADW